MGTPNQLNTVTGVLYGCVDPDNDGNGTWTPLSVSSSIVSKSANYSVDPSVSAIVCTANSFDVTLPDAAGVPAKTYTVKNSGSGIITLKTTSAQTIDGQSTQTLTQYDALTVMSDGANWILV
jgi:hypothetical protein